MDDIVLVLVDEAVMAMMIAESLSVVEATSFETNFCRSQLDVVC